MRSSLCRPKHLTAQLKITSKKRPTLPRDVTEAVPNGQRITRLDSKSFNKSNDMLRELGERSDAAARRDTKGFFWIMHNGTIKINVNVCCWDVNESLRITLNPFNTVQSVHFWAHDRHVYTEYAVIGSSFSSVHSIASSFFRTVKNKDVANAGGYLAAV